MPQDSEPRLLGGRLPRCFTEDAFLSVTKDSITVGRMPCARWKMEVQMTNINTAPNPNSVVPVSGDQMFKWWSSHDLTIFRVPCPVLKPRRDTYRVSMIYA